MSLLLPWWRPSPYGRRSASSRSSSAALTAVTALMLTAGGPTESCNSCTSGHVQRAAGAEERCGDCAGAAASVTDTARQPTFILSRDGSGPMRHHCATPYSQRAIGKLLKGRHPSVIVSVGHRAGVAFALASRSKGGRRARKRSL